MNGGDKSHMCEMSQAHDSNASKRCPRPAPFWSRSWNAIRSASTRGGGSSLKMPKLTRHLIDLSLSPLMARRQPSSAPKWSCERLAAIFHSRLAGRRGPTSFDGLPTFKFCIAWAFTLRLWNSDTKCWGLTRAKIFINWSVGELSWPNKVDISVNTKRKVNESQTMNGISIVSTDTCSETRTIVIK